MLVFVYLTNFLLIVCNIFCTKVHADDAKKIVSLFFHLFIS